MLNHEPDEKGAGRPKRVTLADVAARTHVSLATVSQVLNGRSTCWASVETRKRVMDAVAELGYRPNLSARALRSGETHTIGMITTALGIGSAHTRFGGAEEASERESYTIMLSCHPNTSETEDLRIRNLMDRGVDGFLIYPSEPGPHLELRKLAETGFPLVTLDGASLLDFECDDLCPDYAAVGRLQVRHLIEVGRRRLCLIRTAPNARINVIREMAALAAMSEADLPPPLILTLTQDDIHEWPDPETFEQEIESFFSEHRGRFDGILSFDSPAAVALRVLLKLKLRVPGDVAVIGAGDTLIAQYNALPLSTISTQDHLLGAQAFALLLERMRNKGERGSFKRVLGPPSLLPRQSTVGS